MTRHQRHTTIDTLDLVVPFVDEAFSKAAHALVADLVDVDRYLFVAGEFETGEHPSLDALVVDVGTRRLERMRLGEAVGFGYGGNVLETFPLTIEGVSNLLTTFERSDVLPAIRTRLSEELPDDVAADGPLLAATLAALDDALPLATTEAGRDLLARAAGILRI